MRAEACKRDARQRRGPSTMSRQTQSSRSSGDLPSTCSTAANSAESSIHATPSERLRQKLVEEEIFAKFRPLLPAPLLPLPHVVAGRGHRHRQRKQHKREAIEEANHLLRSLNSLDSGTVTSRTSRRLAEAPAAGASTSSSSLPPATRRLHVLVQRLAALAVRERRAAGSQLPSGAQATSKVIKEDRVSRYSFATSSRKQVALLADLMDEPAVDAPAVPLLEVLPQREKMFYMFEENVVRTDFISDEIFKGLEDQFAFVGGALTEYAKYPHSSSHLWDFTTPDCVKAYCGISAVVKKSGRHRKLLMMVPANCA